MVNSCVNSVENLLVCQTLDVEVKARGGLGKTNIQEQMIEEPCQWSTNTREQVEVAQTTLSQFIAYSLANIDAQFVS